MRKMMNKKGFTLVELMIVVVILGILVAIAVPIYSAVTNNAKKKACAGNIRIIRSNLASFLLTGDGGSAMTDAQATALTAGSGLYGNDTFKAMFDNGKVPTCSNGSETDNEYTINISSATQYTIKCENSGCPNETAAD